MIDVDRDTERRNARLQFAALLLLFAVLLYFAVPDKRVYAALVPPLLLVVGYRAWAVERFSPLLAQSYARAAVAGGGDVIVHMLGTDAWLGAMWSRSGTPLTRLCAVPGDRLSAALSALDRDRYPSRRLAGPLHPGNRLAALALGILLGGAASWAATRISCSRPLPALLGALHWPVWIALLVVVVSRLVVAVHNRGQLARITAAMRSNTHPELTHLLDPPWRGRRAAVVAELNRLGEHADGIAAERPVPELRVIDLLLAAGVVVGFAGALTALTC
jgi:hypothetical protein